MVLFVSLAAGCSRSLEEQAECKDATCRLKSLPCLERQRCVCSKAEIRGRNPKFISFSIGVQFGLAGKVFACLGPGSVEQNHDQKRLFSVKGGRPY